MKETNMSSCTIDNANAKCIQSAYENTCAYYREVARESPLCFLSVRAMIM